MKIRNILYLFILTQINLMPYVFSMEQPTEMEKPIEQSRTRTYHQVNQERIELRNKLWTTILGAKFLRPESAFANLPPEILMQVMHATELEIKKDSNLLLKLVKNNYDFQNENEIIKLLQKPYIEVNLQDNNGDTPLILAVKSNDPESNDPELIQMLLMKGANPDIKNNNGNTPLILAAKSNNPELIKMLLMKGANPDIQNYDGETALTWAGRYNNQEIIQILLDKELGGIIELDKELDSKIK